MMRPSSWATSTSRRRARASRQTRAGTFRLSVTAVAISEIWHRSDDGACLEFVDEGRIDRIVHTGDRLTQLHDSWVPAPLWR